MCTQYIKEYASRLIGILRKLYSFFTHRKCVYKTEIILYVTDRIGYKNAMIYAVD